MIKTKEILKRLGFSDLSSIDDEMIIKLARQGEFGHDTKWSALKVWAFQDEHELAKHIRKAIEQEKELVVVFVNGEGMSEDRVEINYR